MLEQILQLVQGEPEVSGHLPELAVSEFDPDGRTVFVMVAKRSARPLGRRLRVETVGAAG